MEERCFYFASMQKAIEEKVELFAGLGGGNG
nr:MAG TPA: hypothetical protein [Caudoviricetes sp.]